MQCARVVWMQVQAHQCRYHCRWVIVVLHLRELSLSVERTHELWSFNGGDLLQHHCEQATRVQNKKNMCKCNALRLPPPAYHMRKQKTQCTCSVLAPLCSLAWDLVGFAERDISLSNAFPPPEAHLATRRRVACSEIHARSRQCTTPPPQSKHPKEHRYNKTGCGYHRDLD